MRVVAVDMFLWKSFWSLSIHFKSFALFLHMLHMKSIWTFSLNENMLFYFKIIMKVWKHSKMKRLYIFIENWYLKVLSLLHLLYNLLLFMQVFFDLMLQTCDTIMRLWTRTAVERPFELTKGTFSFRGQNILTNK